MTQTDDLITDEMLTAYLDGVLDESVRADIDDILAVDKPLAARLAALDMPLDALRGVMAPATLGAPAMPAGLTAIPPATSATVAPLAAPRGAGLRRLWVPTAIAASFAAGLMVTTVLGPDPDPAAPKWVEAVASYQALYVTETLQHGRQDASTTADVLATAAADFDVTLDPAIDLEGLDFKRAQMLGWNGKPLLQMAYLDGDGTPMALCLTRVSAPDRGPKSSTSHNLAGVSWVKNGVGYYLIGGDDLSRVEDLSEQVIARL